MGNKIPGEHIPVSLRLVEHIRISDIRMCGDTRIPRDTCTGHTIHWETRIPATPVPYGFLEGATSFAGHELLFSVPEVPIAAFQSGVGAYINALRL